MNRNLLLFVVLAAAAAALLLFLSGGSGGGLDTPAGRSGEAPEPPDPLDLLPPPPADQPPEPAVTPGIGARPRPSTPNPGEADGPLADLDTIRALAGTKRYEDAITELDRILAVEPENADALALRGRIYHARGWYRMAEDDLSAAGRYEAPDAARLALQGENLVKLRRTKRAENFLRRSLSLDPEQARPHALLAVLLKKQGDETAAEKEIREAMRIDPEEPLTKILAAGLPDR